MSFLDRLKREAEQQRLQAEAVARERDERETRYKTQIEPQMKALTAYLEGLAATMLEVKPLISIPMGIQGYGDITLVPFWDYKVEHERRHRGFTVSMSWSMRIDSERAPVVRADGVTRVKALIGIFRQYHLGGIKEEKRTLQGDLSCASFQARGYIKSRMEAQISAEDPILRLMFENASWLGSSRRQVPWEQINDSLFDRIARFIVREDDSLFTEELPDALRQRLRKDQEPVGPAVVQAPAPAIRENPQAPTVATVSIPAPAVEPAAPVLQPEYASGFGQGMLAAPAPMTEGEVIEIDESKLGLSDFHEQDEPSSAFSIRSLNRSAPPEATSSAPRAAVPPVAEQGFIPIDESKLGEVSAYAPPSMPPPAAAAPVQSAQANPTQRVTAPAAASTQAVNPHAAAAAHAAMLAQRAAAARAAAAQAAAVPASAAPPAPGPAPAPAAAAPAPVPARTAASAEAAATGSPVPPASAEGEVLDPVKEREAALSRLRMRAMMARLRTDEPDEPKA